MRTHHQILIYSLILLLTQCGPKGHPEPVPNQLVDTSANAMVVTAHPLASQAASKILREGGNAVDAAITAQFALAVVYPRAGNIGGGGFMLWRDSTGQTNSLDFREKAPMAAHRTMYQDESGEVQHDKSLKGFLASGIPGTVAGMQAAFNKYSSLKDWSQLLQPAIDLAENGFIIDSTEASRLNRYREDLLEYNEDTNCPLLRKGDWKEGHILIQRELAQTLRRIQSEGAKDFYEGETAHYLASYVQSNGGLITLEDLKSYEAIWRSPIQVNYKNCKMISMPPPSSGGIALGQLLKSMEILGVNGESLFDSVLARKIIEAERRVYADRAEYLGDVDFVEVPIEKLLDSAYLKSRMANIDLEKPTPSASVVSDSFPISKESYQTTHTSIVDSFGNAVSLTTTLNSNYGSKVWVPGAGFILNNEMDDFSAKPGIPNQFGLVGSEANAIAAEKRMLSSMTPTIFEKNGELYLVLGSPGGSRIITSVFQVFLWLEEMGYPLDRAIAQGRYHHQWLPEKIYVEEERLPLEFLQSLRKSGYELDTTLSYIGLVKAVHRDSTGRLMGSGDPRSRDDARGF